MANPRGCTQIWGGRRMTEEFSREVEDPSRNRSLPEAWNAPDGSVVSLSTQHNNRRTCPMHIIGVIVIGFLAGIVAKLLTPGRDPGGFIVTTLLGIAGAFVATYLGQAIGWYRADEGAGFIGAIVGAIIILAIYHMIVGRRAIR